MTDLELMVTYYGADWAADNGDLTHRLNYDLNENSIVFDLGGYKGDWSKLIYDKFNCNIHILEPVGELFKELRKTFTGDKFTLYKVAAGAKSTTGIISIDGGNSSNHIKGKQKEIIKISNINNIIQPFEIIDLMKINIEGDEYDVLESLISNDNVKKIKNIQVQFHIFVDNCVERRNRIRELLASTHICTYNYDFIWENWQLIK